MNLAMPCKPAAFLGLLPLLLENERRSGGEGGSSWEGGEGERKTGREVPEQFHSTGSV